jgi:hypothetical protein
MSARKSPAPGATPGGNAAVASKPVARSTRGKKGEPEPAVEAPIVPAKSEEELLEEELAATLRELGGNRRGTALSAV